MDETKCKAIKAELGPQPGPQLVEAERFFDGNDDEGSIGCNLSEHPGVDTFRDVFAGFRRRSDVSAVYVQIYELDPGDGFWPFTDTIFVVGTISVDDLREAVSKLGPSEITEVEQFGVPPAIAQRYGSPVLAVWWD